MKKLFLFPCIFVSLAAMAQTKVNSPAKPAKTTKAAPAARREMARLIRTRVMIKDTSTLGTVTATYGDPSFPLSYHIADTYVNYLEPSYFYEFKQSIHKMARSKAALIYSGWNLDSPLKVKEITDRYTLCDSIIQVSVDADGNEIVTSTFHCDSTSRIENVAAVNFYESWYFNESNAMIEKEVLAYEILSYDQDKNAFRPLFMIVKDEEARKKLIRLYFN